MKLDFRLSELVAILLRYWNDPIGLVVGWVAGLVLARFLLRNEHTYIGYAVVMFIVFGIWFFCRRIPRAPRGKLHFLLCIHCESNKEARQVQADFFDGLRALIGSGHGAEKIHFTVAPNQIAKQVISTQDALRLRKRARAHFMLYGKVRFREIRSKERWFIDLNGIVSHSPVPIKTGQGFAREFRELLPRQVQIDRGIDVLAFEFTSRAVSLVSRYIVGIAAAFSGELEYAETLFMEVLQRIPKNSEFPIHAKLRSRTPRHLAAIYHSRAGDAYNRWLRNPADEMITLLCSEISKVPESERGSLRSVQLGAICWFLRTRDAAAALEILLEHPYGEDPAWRFSVAFLNAYQGELRNAARQYRALRFSSIEPETLREVEEFMYWIEREEEAGFVANYCLAWINWYVKGDRNLARQEFDRFLRRCPEHRHEAEKTRVERLIRSEL